MAEKDERRAGILGDFSLSQIVATGLAAATSFALSAQIGIAGSIIGAVIGAVASSVATQVYRNLLNASAEKLRSLGPDQTARGTAPVPGEVPPTAGETRLMPTPVPADRTRVAASGTPIAPPEVIDAAHERQRTRLRRRVAVIATVAAVAVVLAYALVVGLATPGAGIGPSLSPAEPVVVDERTEGERAPQADEAPSAGAEDEGASEQPTGPADSPAEGGSATGADDQDADAQGTGAAQPGTGADAGAGTGSDSGSGTGTGAGAQGGTGDSADAGADSSGTGGAADAGGSTGAADPAGQP